MFSSKKTRTKVIFVCSKEFRELIGKTKLESLQLLSKKYDNFEVTKIYDGNLEAETRRALNERSNYYKPPKEVLVEHIKSLHLIENGKVVT